MNYYYQSSMGLPGGPDKPSMYQGGLAGPVPVTMASAFQQQNGMPGNSYPGAVPGGVPGSSSYPGSSLSSGFSPSPQYGGVSGVGGPSYPPTTSFTSSLPPSPYNTPITMYSNPHAGLYGQPLSAGPYLQQSGVSGGLGTMHLSRQGMPSQLPTSTTAQSLYASSSPSMPSSMYYSSLGPQVGGLYPSSMTGSMPGSLSGSSLPGSSIPGSSLPGSSMPGSSMPGSSIPGYPPGGASLGRPLSGGAPLSSYPGQMQPSPYGLPAGPPYSGRPLI